MKLSIITPVYRQSKLLRVFLERISNQKSKLFELVLVLDTNTEDNLSVIDDFKDKIDNLKVVFNSKRTSRTQAINSGIRIATGEYSIIMSISNYFENTMVEDILNVIKKSPSDIIEFNARIRSPIKFQGRQRKLYSKPTDIKSNPLIIAYTYPFDFNKIYKNSILLESINTQYKNSVNSRYSIEFVYRIFTFAKTYSNVNKKIIRSKTKTSSTFNPLKLVRQCEETIKEISTNPNVVMEYFDYALYFSIVVIWFAITKESKNKILLEKLKHKFKDLEMKHFKHLFKLNSLFIANAKEAEILRANKSPSNFHKIYKELDK